MTGVILYADGKYHRATMIGRHALTPANCDADEKPDAKVVFSAPPDAEWCHRCRLSDEYVSPLREGFEGEPV